VLFRSKEKQDKQVKKKKEAVLKAKMALAQKEAEIKEA
jgi:hypothetical protein